MFTQHSYANGRLLATRTESTLTHVQPDHLGSTTTLTNSGGTVVAQERYAAFGERRRASNVEPTDQLYTSQRYSFQTGLYHYSDGRSAGRYYDPVLGRFVKPDNFVPDPSTSHDLNRYSYGRNNPLTYTDPSGNACVPCLGLLLMGLALSVQDDTVRVNEPPPSHEAIFSGNVGIGMMAIGAGLQLGQAIVAGPAGQEALRQAQQRGQQTAQQGQKVADKPGVAPIHQILPGISRIEVAAPKLEYILRQDQGKAKGFGLFGFTPENADQLRQTLASFVPKIDLAKGIVTQYGTKYEQIVEIVGPSGIRGKITIVWQVDKGSDVIRFITAIPEPYK